MPTKSQERRPQRRAKHARHRIIVVAVPPVAELDLVGPLQVFASANRLAGKALYSVEVFTAGKEREIPGEGGLLSFVARGTLREVTGKFDSVLLDCGTARRNARDTELSAWL